MNKEKVLSFQGLRALAIICVFVSHCNNLLLNSSGTNAFTYFGAFGVQCFIIVSGFLSVMRYSGSDIRTFALLKSRLKKFYPLLF